MFAFDVLVCDTCRGPMTVVAYLTDLAVVHKILAHLGLPTHPPPLAPARLPAQVEMFDDATPDGPAALAPRRRQSRAPPSPSCDDDALVTDEPTDSTDWGA